MVRLSFAVVAFCLLVCASCVNVIAQDHYAIAVGVESYDTGVFEPLEFANEDARELAKALETLGFKTTVMSSDEKSSKLRPSTPSKIIDVLKSQLATIGEKDTFILSLSGHGVQFSDEREKNQVEAVKWYRKAAEQGNAFGQNNLGIAYGLGNGVEKNLVEAVKWYRRAAEQGDADAINRLKSLGKE